MKVLIFYASYGGGHLNAAKSIENCIKTNYTDIDVEMIDCMKYVNKTIEKWQKKHLGLGEEFIQMHKKDHLLILQLGLIKLWQLNY